MSSRSAVGTIGFSVPAGDNSGSTTAYWSFGDFNGDGITDAFNYVSGVSGADMFLANSTGLMHDKSWTDSWSGDASWYIGDFDGDGKDDILRTVAGVSNADVLLSTGNGFTAPGTWLEPDGVVSAWQIGDFNGDGRDDLFRFTSSGGQVFLSTGNAFLAAGTWTVYGSGSTGWHLGDFDGDGKTDLLRIAPGVSGAEVLLSDGTTFGDGSQWTTLVPMGDWKIIDLNGDQKDDIVDNIGRVLTSNGSGFTYVGDFPLEAGDQILAVGGPSDAEGLDILIKGASDSSISDIAERPLDVSTLGAPLGVSAGLAPRLDYIGKPVEISVDGITSGMEARLVASKNGETWYSDWSPSSKLSITPEEAGQYTFTVQVRDASDQQIVFQQYGGRITYVYSAEDPESVNTDRLKIQDVVSDISHSASERAWRSSITTLTDLSDYIDRQYHVYISQESIPDSDLQKSLYSLQFVSGMWAYGNLNRPNPGEVTDNEITGKIDISDINATLFINSIIGGCEDFASMLEFLLEKSGIESRVVLNPSHVFNEAFLDGKWWTLDPTYGFAMDTSFDDALQPSSSPTVYLFSQEGRMEESPLYRDLLTQGMQGQLSLINYGDFPNANRYQALDYFSLYDYGSTFTNELDLSGWTPESPMPLSIPPNSGGILLNDFLFMSSLERLKILDHGGDASANASASGWRAGITTFQQLLSTADEQFAAVDPEPTGNDQAFFYLQWVSGLWGFAATGTPAGSTAVELLGQTTASSDDRTALLAALLSHAGLANRVVVLPDGSSFNEVVVDGQSWVLDATGGLAFKGDWLSINDTSTDTEVRKFPVTGRVGSSDIYSPEFASATSDMLVKVANGSLPPAQYQSVKDWLVAHTYGQTLLNAVDSTNPSVVSIERTTEDSFVAIDTNSLSFTVTFSEPVAQVDSSDFIVIGTSAMISGVEDHGNGKYEVIVSGGDLGTKQSMVALGINIHLDISDIFGNLLNSPIATPVEGVYFVGIFTPFVDQGAQLLGSPGGEGWYTGDFNGDGKDDIFRYVLGQENAGMYLSTGHGFDGAGNWTTAGHGQFKWAVGDFDGDGKDDILRYVPGQSGNQDVSGQSGTQVLESTGTAFGAPTSWTDADPGSEGWYVGDFNGDGKDDVLRYVPGQSGADMYLSTGQGFASAGSWTDAWHGQYKWTIGDFNGDGKDDILRSVAATGETDVLISTGSRFVADNSWNFAGDVGVQWLSGDINGDGRDDIYRTNNGQLEFSLSLGNTFSEINQFDKDRFGSNFSVGDVNGDGSMDIIRYSDNDQETIVSASFAKYFLS